MPQPPINCPSCGREFSPDTAGRQPTLCPHCGALYIIDDVTDPSPDQPAPESPHDQLQRDHLRIGQIIRIRRSLIRTRGWCITAAIACLVLAAQQIAWLIAALAHAPWTSQQSARLSFAIILVAVAMLLRQRIIHLSSELQRKSLPEPTTPPDFSSLCDGSQHARNLENLDNK